jgi:hypothetical protein
MNNEELPRGVRAVPAQPAVRWQVTTQSGLHFDGYVFDDDPSDLAKMFRWLANSTDHSYGTTRLVIQRVL